MSRLNEYSDPNNNMILRVISPPEEISLEEAHELLQGRVRMPIVEIELEE